MSEATDLIAEVKRSVARVERGVNNFEKDIETIGAWTDLAQLRIAASRLHLFEDSLRARRVDLEEASAPVPEPEAVQEPVGDAPPDRAEGADVSQVAAGTEPQVGPFSQQAGIRPLTDADLAPAAEGVEQKPAAPGEAGPDAPQA